MKTTCAAITFANNRRRIYLPLEEICKALGVSKRRLKKLTPSRTLVNGTGLISLTKLIQVGIIDGLVQKGRTVIVRNRRHLCNIIVGSKKAEVNLAKQRLRAWQGGRLVLESRVSSGRRGTTPTGRFRAGPYKARYHYSSRYDNAPMPWSVQVTGHIFIHGFFYVPKYPASHGCIRLPYSGRNPAKFFYDWIDRGTPIRILRR